MITEKEAQAKWCPYVGESRYLRQNEMCEGSGCMAWRWFGFPCDEAWTEAVKKAADEIGDKHPSKANAAKHVNANREKYGLSTDKLGYCGLAGRPQ